MKAGITVGEGSGVVTIFFLWLATGLELLLLWAALGWLYLFASFVISLIYGAVAEHLKDMKDMEGALTVDDVRMNQARRYLLAPPVEEKHYALGGVALTVLKGPVKLSLRRTAILLGVVGAGFALFFLLLVTAFPHYTNFAQQLTLAAVLPLLLVINLLEVRWRRADALRSSRE